jgi:hypothetical protein
MIMIRTMAVQGWLNRGKVTMQVQMEGCWWQRCCRHFAAVPGFAVERHVHGVLAQQKERCCDHFAIAVSVSTR